MATSLAVHINQLKTVLDTLECIITPGFGPNSLNTMLSTSTGQLMVTNTSSLMLDAVHLSHPFGRTIVNAIKRHVSVTGDGGKTFIILLSAILREMSRKLSSVDSKTAQQHRIVLMKGFVDLRCQLHPLMSIIAKCCKHVDSTSVNELKQECTVLVSTHLQGCLPMKSVEHLTGIIMSFLFEELPHTCNIKDILSDCLKNFDNLYLETVGFPVTQMRILKGFVLQRDFHSIHRSITSAKGHIKLIIIGCSLSGEDEDNDAVFTAHSRHAVDNALLHKGRVARKIVLLLKNAGVSLLISTEKLSLMETSSCQTEGISTIQMADEEETNRLSQLCGISIVYSLSDLVRDCSSYIGKVSSCETVILSGHRYVLLETEHPFMTDKMANILVAKQILITGHSKGTCYQVRSSIKNCLVYLHHWMNMGHHLCDCHGSKCIPSLPGGGAFDLTLHYKLRSLLNDRSCTEGFTEACSILSRALLMVPLVLLRNSYHPHAKHISIADFLNDCNANIEVQSQMWRVDGRSGKLTCDITSIRETLVSRTDLIHHLLELVIQLLRTDQLVSVCKLDLIKDQKLLHEHEDQ